MLDAEAVILGVDSGHIAPSSSNATHSRPSPDHPVAIRAPGWSRCAILSVDPLGFQIVRGGKASTVFPLFYQLRGFGSSWTQFPQGFAREEQLLSSQCPFEAMLEGVAVATMASSKRPSSIRAYAIPANDEYSRGSIGLMRMARWLQASCGNVASSSDNEKPDASPRCVRLRGSGSLGAYDGDPGNSVKRGEG